MKVGIVGAGAVGSACFFSVVMRGSAREVVLVNRDRKRARGVVRDVEYGAVLSPPIAVADGDYYMRVAPKFEAPAGQPTRRAA